jgi:hypothetical protein
MNGATANDRNAFLEYAAAELTAAAYPVVLRHGVGLRWLDLELNLWKAMIETVRKLEKIEMESVAEPRTLPRSSDCVG